MANRHKYRFPDRQSAESALEKSEREVLLLQWALTRAPVWNRTTPKDDCGTRYDVRAYATRNASFVIAIHRHPGQSDSVQVCGDAETVRAEWNQVRCTHASDQSLATLRNTILEACAEAIKRMLGADAA